MAKSIDLTYLIVGIVVWYGFSAICIQLILQVENKTGNTTFYLCYLDPEEVRNLQVRNSTSESLIICWEKPCFVNGLLVGYNLTIAERSSMETGPCATVHELQPYTYYNVSVFTVNNIGGSQPKVIRHQTEIASKLNEYFRQS